MLDNLTQRLAKVVKTMRGEARLTESNTAEMLREVRLALLEADVALPAVREFSARVKEKALGEEVIGSLSPGQALVGVVQRELATLMGADLGPDASQLNFATQPPAIILMAGLQGAGKTTTVGKLAKYLKEDKKKKVLTVSADVYRPAAIAQLESVSKQVDVDFFPTTATDKPVDIARNALDWARRHYHDVLIIDTAGRLGIDEAMMQEIAAVHAAVNPIETLFVVDAMLGQDAINTAKAFNDALPLTGVVLTTSPASRSSLPACPRNWMAWKPSTPSAWPTACSAWATSSPWWKKHARAWTPRRQPTWPTRSRSVAAST